MKPEENDRQIREITLDWLKTSDNADTKALRWHALKMIEAAESENQELRNEVARLTRNEKCYGCGHSRENHDPSGCLVWVNADAERKCLCKVWTATETRS